ncbi:hypothetical protein ACHAWF_007493, partial [Thalassiosira exigua]
ANATLAKSQDPTFEARLCEAAPDRDDGDGDDDGLPSPPYPAHPVERTFALKPGAAPPPPHQPNFVAVATSRGWSWRPSGKSRNNERGEIMRISRQSLLTRRRGVATNIPTVSRKRWGGVPSSAFFARLLLVGAASLLLLHSNFLARIDDDRKLRSSVTPVAKPSAPSPESAIKATKQFNPTDFVTKKLSPPPVTSVILFYNLFIPDEDEGAKHAIEVITEQLGQIASSIQKLENDKRSAALFYNSIGNARAFPEDKMKSLCSSLHPQLSCREIGRYETASESVTLQDIYDFCQNEDNAESRVTYIHSKGSYHQTEVNANWRRALTDAVVHPDCLSPSDDRCNVCGAQFYTRFSTIFPGNMWTAKCAYVKRLLPPIEGGEYDKRKKESIMKFLRYRLWGVLKSTLMKDRMDYFGLGRFRLEHWIGSHPSIMPCELHRLNATFERMVTGNIRQDNYEWGMGPRRNEILATDESPVARERLEKDNDAQLREYFFLPGNLLKWFTLYGPEGIPSSSSWAWKFFPAGDKWKELVEKHGESAIEELALQSSREYHSAYISVDGETEQFQIHKDDEKLLSGSNPPLVVFYQISILEGKKLEALLALKTQLDVLSMGQYDIISRSHHRQRHVILYYTVAGDSSDMALLKKVCEAKSRHITCRNLGETSSARAVGESLHQLHQFCLAKPSLGVTYLANSLPRPYGVNRTELHTMQKIRAYTTAVTSKMCIKSRKTCNVCGTEFYPFPYNHFTGNMFSASCDYVKDLLPPKKFESAMDEVAGDALESKLRSAITTELIPFTPQNLGLRRYSVEHWIGSHPDFEPCDVAPVRHRWFPWFYGNSYIPNDYTSSRAYDFMWEQAPRRSSAPALQLSQEVISLEYFYLAGNLIRWFKLYNKAPSGNSWVWQWYPNGNRWMLGIKEHGPNAVAEISGHFLDNEGVPFMGKKNRDGIWNFRLFKKFWRTKKLR